jgi:hypothetical protein
VNLPTSSDPVPSSALRKRGELVVAHLVALALGTAAVSTRAMAGAVLSKGLVGLVLPGAILVAYSAASRDWRVWRRMHWLGGVALLRCIPMLDKLKLTGDEQIGVNIVRKALEVPVRKIAETGVDYISIGALTHSVKAVDISMEILT